MRNQLIFQSLTYNRETPCCNQNVVPVLLVMTSNAPDSMYAPLLQGYQQTLSRFVGPTEVFVCGDTMQLKDYGKTDWEWTLFDPEAKRERHERVFPQQRAQAYQKGVELVGSQS